MQQNPWLEVQIAGDGYVAQEAARQLKIRN
jgi:hypothetical protein